MLKGNPSSFEAPATSASLPKYVFDQTYAPDQTNYPRSDVTATSLVALAAARSISLARTANQESGK